MRSRTSSLIPGFPGSAPLAVAARVIGSGAGIGVACGLSVLATAAALPAEEFPQIPGQQWRIHDPNRPAPLEVTPGDDATRPPSDAIVLFDGRDLSAWEGTGEVADGAVAIRKSPLKTKASFGDIQLHLEFAEPEQPIGTGQARGNSGVFLMGRYEIQVLDSFHQATYPDGQAGAIYGQFPPLVNACRAPGAWQTYDIVFTAPRFAANTLVTPAYATVLHNGVLVQNHQELLGPTSYRDIPVYKPHGDGPLLLQDHGTPVRYRNIWVRRLDAAPAVPATVPAPAPKP